MNWTGREITGGAGDALMWFDLLREGGELRPFHPRLRLRPAEFAVAERPADYARLYAVDAEWTHVGSPFGLDPFRHAGHALANGGREERAMRDAVLQWREWHRNLVTVTSLRLMIHHEVWHSFWYEEMDELVPVFDHPRRGHYGLTAAFSDAPRLGLFGPYVLSILLLAEYFSGRFEVLTSEPGFRRWHAEMTGGIPAPG
ncbi:hypothetical protein [Spirillospora sp. NPDC047279]|uniref:hypothetical protein n=1 Tax=Spirillospora sp. NPDC047279 TaxID=3155478 RepID=UPI0033F4E243